MKIELSEKEVEDIRKGLIIAMQSSDHWSMKLLFGRLEEIAEKLDAQTS